MSRPDRHSPDGSEQPASAGADLEGRVAIVPGAASGVGREVVRIFAAAGAFVVAEDISPTVHDLDRLDGAVAAIQGDVGRRDAADRAVALALERFGRLDVLVNNAARLLVKGLVDTTDDDFDALYATNVRGAFVHARAAVPHLTERDGAAIVNVASISGVVGLVGQAAYAATKGAIVQLTRQMAVELAPAGVRVNAVGPGAIDTPFVHGALAAAPDSSAALDAIRLAHPLGRIAQPEEIAEVVVFLASSRAAFMTGAIVMADGGYTAR
jgi:NAD(P)-dependent dehydrogenase (short-subunit alcohol dehydrogenase family)